MFSSTQSALTASWQPHHPPLSRMHHSTNGSFGASSSSTSSTTGCRMTCSDYGGQTSTSLPLVVSPPLKNERIKFLSRMEALKQRRLILLLCVDNVLLCRTRVPEALLQGRHEGTVFPLHNTPSATGTVEVVVLRPWLRSFLQRLSRSFQMTLVCSMDSAGPHQQVKYIQRLTTLLDPTSELFEGRHVSSWEQLRRQHMELDERLVLMLNVDRFSVNHSQDWFDSISFAVKPFFHDLKKQQRHSEENNLYLSTLRAFLEDMHRRFFSLFDVKGEVAHFRELLMKFATDEGNGSGYSLMKNKEKRVSLGCSSGYSTENDGETESLKRHKVAVSGTGAASHCSTCSFTDSRGRQEALNMSDAARTTASSPTIPSAQSSPMENSESVATQSGPNCIQEENILRDYLKEYESILKEQTLIRTSWSEDNNKESEKASLSESTSEKEVNNSGSPSSMRTKFTRWNYLVSRKDQLLRILVRSASPDSSGLLSIPEEITSLHGSFTTLDDNEVDSKEKSGVAATGELTTSTKMDSSYDIISDEELHQVWLLRTTDLFPETKSCSNWFSRLIH